MGSRQRARLRESVRRMKHDARRLRGHIGRGLLLSLLLHSSAVLPLIAAAVILGGREAAERENEVGLEMQEVSEDELPDGLPSIDDADDVVPEPKRRAAKTPVVAERQPEPETPPEPTPETPPEAAQPRPPEPEKRNRKSVDLDNDKEVEPPPDAKYLAQKNNRTDVETRAADTNLEREQKGEKGSSPSERKDEEVGDEDDKIAELEDQKSRLGREAPNVTPRQEQDLPREGAKQNKTLLSLRDTPDRMHQVTPETADPTLPADPEGLKPFREEGLQSLRDLKGKQGSASSQRLRLTADQYRYLFGDDAEAAERLAQQERSRRGGRFAARMERARSALENFIPEVRPGNQTALNTRAAPFAAFIARMHRSIHKLWGFGFLDDIDGKPMSNPFNDRSLMTKLEIVLNADGSIHRVGVIRASGNTGFDVAAVDVAYSAGPYPEPPRAIRSGNGKIYVHWAFHRDERMCSTAGAEYFILDNAPPEADRADGEPTRGIPTPRAPAAAGLKRLERNLDSPEQRAKMRELDEAAGGPEGEKPPEPAREVARATDPAARATAEQWFDAFVRRDTRRLARYTGFPFKAASGVAATSAGELGPLLESALEDAGSRPVPRALQLYSSAGARAAMGSLPPGFEDETDVLYATAHIAGDTFVLVVDRGKSGWKAVGLFRR